MNFEFINKASRNLFFTGKGGVGKTSLSCATAIALADQDKRVLLVSTDPASNLDEVLNVQLCSQPTPVPAAPGLFALNIDPEESARLYREKMVAPYRGVLPAASIKSIEEQLSGACTVEIAAFDEFSRLLGDEAATKEFDHIVFDTAPTGHTLRLLELPSAWSGFIESNAGGTSCLGPLAGLAAQKELYKNTLHALADPIKTTIVLVSRPEKSALKEAERTRKELFELGISNQHLILNGIFEAGNPNDPIAKALEEEGTISLRTMPENLRALPVSRVGLFPFELAGAARLRALLYPFPREVEKAENSEVINANISLAHLSLLIDDIALKGKGVIMTMGKGGVGKTTLASAIAIELTKRGYSVHLSTTDPAAHLDITLADSIDGLEISCIHPEAETKAYAAEVMETAGSHLNGAERALLEEDLRSPCTEEIAVFRAFAKKVADGKDKFVVLDTAPTGHTLLLLDAAESYHREVSRTMSNLPESVRRLLPRLRDPEFTKIFIITHPAATPVHEAAKLQDDLNRAGIQSFAWIVNQSLYPLKVQDKILIKKRQSEVQFINEVKEKYSQRVVLIPWVPDEKDSISWLQKIMHTQPEVRNNG